MHKDAAAALPAYVECPWQQKLASLPSWVGQRGQLLLCKCMCVVFWLHSRVNVLLTYACICNLLLYGWYPSTLGTYVV